MLRCVQPVQTGVFRRSFWPPLSEQSKISGLVQRDRCQIDVKVVFLPLPISAGGTEPTLSLRPSAKSKVSLRLCRRNIKTLQFALGEVVNFRRPDQSSIS